MWVHAVEESEDTLQLEEGPGCVRGDKGCFLILPFFLSIPTLFLSLSPLQTQHTRLHRSTDKQPQTSTMRLIKQNDDDLAAEEAMRGGFIGAIKYSTVALFAGAVLHATSPRFRAIRPPQKVKMRMLCPSSSQSIDLNRFRAVNMLSSLLQKQTLSLIHI